MVGVCVCARGGVWAMDSENACFGIGGDDIYAQTT